MAYRIEQTGEELQGILNDAVLTKQGLEGEVARAQAAEGVLQENIDSEAGERQSADALLAGNIGTEVARAQQAESDLSARVDENTAGVAAEVARAQEAEGEVWDTLNDEILTRQSQDAALQGNIEREAGLREAGDGQLQGEIDAISGKIPAEASEMNQLADKQYVQEAMSDVPTREEVEDMIDTLSRNEVVVGALPQTGEEGVIYRVPGNGYYTDYMYYDGEFVELSQYSMEFDQTQVGYFVCDTAAGTAAKTVSAAGYTLAVGGNMRVKMTNANTADNVTLNINGAGAKTLYYNGEQASASNSWEAGEVLEVYYDGEKYCSSNTMGIGKSVVQEALFELSLDTDASDNAVELSLFGTADSAPLEFTGVLYGSETGGTWDDSSTRAMFLSKEVSAGDTVHVKTNTGYRFVLASYNVVVAAKADITPAHFIEQYENTWVTEDTYVLPSAAKSVVVKISKTNNGVITSDDTSAMISIAEVSREGGIESPISSVMLESATSETAGLMSADNFKNISSLFPTSAIDLSNHILGTETGGVWSDNNTRMMFYNIPVEKGDEVYVKSNNGYKFVITAYNVVVTGKSDIQPTHFVEQYEPSWVTEDSYVVPDGVLSIVLKTAKNNDTSMASVSADSVIGIATIKKSILTNVGELEDSVERIDRQLNGNAEERQLVLTNHAIGTETGGVWEGSYTRILFFAGAVNYRDVVHVKANDGYRFVISGYNVVVEGKADVTAGHFVEQYEPSWVTEDSYVVPATVKSVVIKVSKTSNGNITGDNPDLMIATATATTPAGLVTQVSDITDDVNVLMRNGSHVDYDGERISLVKNNMLYSLFGTADDAYVENGVSRAAEGLAVYGDYMFRFYINGLCKSFDISGGSPVLVSSFALGSHALSDNHCNCSQFAGGIASGDTFPLVYIANCVYPICYVEQMTTSSSSLVQTITVNSSFSFVWCNVSAGDDGCLYAVGINCQANVNGTMKVIKHTLPSVAQGDVTLDDADALDSFELAYDGSVHGLQGMEVRNGKIFLPMNGTGNASNGIIRVIDIASKSIQTDIPLSFHAYECEDVSVYGDVMYIGYFGSTAIFKLRF